MKNRSPSSSDLPAFDLNHTNSLIPKEALVNVFNRDTMHIVVNQCLLTIYGEPSNRDGIHVHEISMMAVSGEIR